MQGRLRLVNPAKAASDPSLAEFELSVIYNPLCKLTPDEDYDFHRSASGCQIDVRIHDAEALCRFIVFLVARCHQQTARR